MPLSISPTTPFLSVAGGHDVDDGGSAVETTTAAVAASPTADDGMVLLSASGEQQGLLVIASPPSTDKPQQQQLATAGDAVSATKTHDAEAVAGDNNKTASAPAEAPAAAAVVSGRQRISPADMTESVEVIEAVETDDTVSGNTSNNQLWLIGTSYPCIACTLECAVVLA